MPLDAARLECRPVTRRPQRISVLPMDVRRAIALMLIVTVRAGAQAGPTVPAAKPVAARMTAPAKAAAPAWKADSVRPGTVLETVADSIVARTTFVPAGQAWLTAAVRGKRLLLDIGRVDIEVRRDSSRARAYRMVIPKHSTVPVGTKLRLRGPFGTLDTEVTGFDVWASRVVATLALTPRIDSLARKNDRLTASAYRSAMPLAGPTAVTPAPSSVPSSPAAPPASSPAAAPAVAAPADSAPRCVRDSLPTDVRYRVKEVKDSLDLVVRAVPRPAYTGVSKKVFVKMTQVNGCFGIGRTAVSVVLRDDRGEWFVERLVLLDERGRIVAVKVADLRFRWHELLGAYDADGDGFDDLATRAVTERAGATTILRLDTKGKKFERLTAGFAWEDM